MRVQTWSISDTILIFSPDAIDGESEIPKPKKPKKISQVEPPVNKAVPFSGGYGKNYRTRIVERQ